MSYDSYKLSLPSSASIRERMLSEKKRQIRFLYDQAVDREDNTLLNGTPFTESPRIFGRKFVDTIHHKITVETISEKDQIECGDYLSYDNMMWLCLNSYSFHKLYCRATFMSCDWKIYWTDKNGKLQSQYVIAQNSAQYNSGETDGPTITLGSSQHMLRMQCNPATLLLDSSMRFAIDKNIEKPTCYKVTQNDNISYNYGKGLCCVTVSEVPFNPITDRLITLDDGSQVWVCGYRDTPPLPPVPPTYDETTDLTAVISGNPKLKNGYHRTYTATIYDSEGKEMEWRDSLYSWKVISSFQVEQETTGNKIKLKVRDESLIGSSFSLQLTHKGCSSILAEQKITITELIGSG